MEQKSAGYYIGKGLASLAICAAAAYCIYVTDSSEGIGWAVFGLLIIW